MTNFLLNCSRIPLKNIFGSRAWSLSLEGRWWSGPSTKRIEKVGFFVTKLSSLKLSSGHVKIRFDNAAENLSPERRKVFLEHSVRKMWTRTKFSTKILSQCFTWPRYCVFGNPSNFSAARWPKKNRTEAERDEKKSSN